ncbi:MAG: ferrous iron transport protein A [Phycisphaerae bacterium]|nr:ferrous iron transport protein A [Phycisphaerae bacterium]
MPRDSQPDMPRYDSLPVVPLSDVLTGQPVVLAGISGGRGLRHRLAEMGLTPGARLEVVNRGRPGPLIISVKHTRLMLGRGAAHRVMVSPLPPARGGAP